MITDDGVGGIAASREPAEFAAAVARALAGCAPRADIRSHAARFDWAAISRGQMELFERALVSRSSMARTMLEAAP